MALERLLILASEPRAGAVMTQLSPPLPPDEAAALYEACQRDVVALCARERARVELWYNNDLRDAFERSFADDAQNVVIVRSEVPTLPESILNGVFDQIRESELVIGPTRDGGCYLIGTTRAAWPRTQQLFDGVASSNDLAFRKFADRAARLQLDMRILPGWYHVETIDDLRQALLDAAEDSNLARWADRPEALHFINAG